MRNLSSKTYTLLLGAMIYILCGFFWSQAMGIVKPADTYPKIVIAAALFLNTLMVVTTLLFSKNQVITYPFKETNFSRVLVTIISTVVYYYGMKYIGFYISTFVYLIALVLLLNDRELTRKDYLVILFMSVVVTGAVFVTFKVFLSVPTPEGLLM